MKASRVGFQDLGLTSSGTPALPIAVPMGCALRELKRSTLGFAAAFFRRKGAAQSEA